MSVDLLWSLRPSGEGGRKLRDREVARADVAHRDGRQQRVVQLAGDVPLERGPRGEDVEAAEAAGFAVREPGLREQAGHGGDGRGELVAELGVLRLVCPAKDVADEERV